MTLKRTLLHKSIALLRYWVREGWDPSIAPWMKTGRGRGGMENCSPRRIRAPVPFGSDVICELRHPNLPSVTIISVFGDHGQIS